MIYDPTIGALYADDGDFLKTVHCPMALQLEELAQASTNSSDRHCHACNTTIRCIDEMTDTDMKSALAKEKDVCVFATAQAKHVVVLGQIGLSVQNAKNTRSIRTARSYEEMQDAVARGFKLQITLTGEDQEIGVPISLYLHRPTGALHLLSLQFRPRSFEEEFGTTTSKADWESLGTARHRPDRPFPFSSYIIPANIETEERVFLKDLIEDVVVGTAGTETARLLSSYARWDGQRFRLEPSYFGTGIVG